MSGKHKRTSHPEFKGMEGAVWEALNNIGRSIPDIETVEGYIKDNPAHAKYKSKPIWHSKAEVDQYVEGSLGLRLEDYGDDMSNNALYKAVANKIAALRKDGVLIDWRQIKSRNNTGMGVWRLDKKKLEAFALKETRKHMKSKNFYSKIVPQTVFYRQYQQAFKEALLRQYGLCVFCRFKLQDYLIGAHIVPYSVMRKEDPHNSMNPANGLLLCRFCDTAFENGMITVEKDYGIEVSDVLRDNTNTMVRTWLGSISGELVVTKRAKYPPDPKYLDWKRRLPA